MDKNPVSQSTDSVMNHSMMDSVRQQDFTVVEFIKTFKAISNQTRLRILNLLFQKDLFVCEISELLDYSNSNISSHLSILERAGYIVEEKNGRWVKYRINQRTENIYSQQLLGLLNDWFKSNSFFEQDFVNIDNIDCYKICRP